jgi:acyl carrier protein
MNTGDGIPGRVRALLSQVLGVAPEAIGPNFSTDTAPAWTSLNHLMLISQVESEFGVFFTNQEIQQLTSFDRIVEAIAGRGGG